MAFYMVRYSWILTKGLFGMVSSKRIIKILIFDMPNKNSDCLWNGE